MRQELLRQGLELLGHQRPRLGLGRARLVAPAASPDAAAEAARATAGRYVLLAFSQRKTGGRARGIRDRPDSPAAGKAFERTTRTHQPRIHTDETDMHPIQTIPDTTWGIRSFARVGSPPGYRSDPISRGHFAPK